MLEPSGRGGDEDVLVGGAPGVDPDAGHVLVQPLSDRAERVVVEGVHQRGLEAVLLRPAVPALPDRGRAVADRVAPRREALVEQEAVGDVGVAGVGEDGAEQRDADEAGGEMAVVALDVGDQAFGRLAAQVRWEQIHVQRQQVHRLRVALDVGVVPHVRLVEGGDDVAVQRLVMRLAIRAPEHARNLRHELRVVGEVGGREHLTRRVGAHGEPVAVVVVAPRRPQQVGVVADEIGDVALHRVPVALEDPHVAVALVDHPRDDHPGVRPGGRTVALERQPRRDVGIRALRRLGVEDVVAPFGDEGGDVHVERRARQEHLRVGQPAEPLVALRAVRRDRQEVAALAPCDVAPQAVDHVARALEPPRPRRVRVDHAARDGLQRGRFRQPRDLDVAEPVEGEARLEDLAAAAAQDVGLLRPRRPQVRQVQGAVRLQHLGEPQPHGRAALALDRQTDPADHVLTEVEHVHAGLLLGDGDRAQVLRDADRLGALGDECRVVERARPDGRPVAVVVVRVGPAVELVACVVVLAVQQVGVPDRPGPRAPAVVAGQDLQRPVRVLDVQLAQQLGVGAVVGAGAFEVEADEARVPPVAQDRRQRVGALAEQLRHVVRGVLDPPAVVGPAGRQHGVADACAVDLQLDDAASGRVQHRPARVSAHAEPAAQVGGRVAALQHDVGGDLGLGARHGDARVLGAVAPDPFRAPARQAGAEARRCAPGRRHAVLVPDLHAPPAVRRRRQRAAGVHDVDRGGGLDAAAVPQTGAGGLELARIEGDHHVIRRLSLRALGGFERPAQPWRGVVDARDVASVFAAQGDRSHRHLSLHRAGCQAVHDPSVEEHEHDQRRDRDQQDVGEQQVVRGGELALEVEQRQLHGRVLVAGEEVERVDEVVEDRHRLHDDHGDRDGLQQREDDAEEDAQRAGAVDRGGLVELARDRGDERPEQQDRERQPERDLDQDHALERLEQAQLLHHPDGRDDGRRDDQAAEDQHVGDLRPLARPPLEHVGDHRRQHDHDRDAGDGDDRAVDERRQEHVVARLDRRLEVLEQHPVGRQRELQLPGLGLRLGRRQHDERERHEEDDADDRDEDRAQEANAASHSCTSRRRRNEYSGRTIAVTRMNSTTLPAVERP